MGAIDPEKFEEDLVDAICENKPNMKDCLEILAGLKGLAEEKGIEFPDLNDPEFKRELKEFQEKYGEKMKKALGKNDDKQDDR